LGYLTREFLYGAIRSSIQIGAGVVGWFLQVELAGIDLTHIGFVISAVLVIVVFGGLEVARARRFRQLYWEFVTTRGSFTRFYLPGIAFGVIVAVILCPLGVYTRMNFDQPAYVLILSFAVWPEIWLAHRRYQAD
jgi:hypothetical protein